MRILICLFFVSTCFATSPVEEFFIGMVDGLQEDPTAPSQCVLIFPEMSTAFSAAVAALLTDPWDTVLHLRVWTNYLNTVVERCAFGALWS